METAESRKLLRAKFETWLDMKHPNILPFLGLKRRMPGAEAPLCMVSPWMENGELLQYLQRNPDADKLGMILGIAKGLEYLHAQDPPLLHGDIRASNVLVSSEGEPVLCDYGTLDLMEDHVDNTTVSLDWARWRAPECNDPRFGPQHGRTPYADIFSFGMLCYELLSGKPPYYRQNSAMAVNRLITGDRPELLPQWTSDHVGSVLVELVVDCWQQIPESRPSASLVVQKLTAARSSAGRG